jgi:hypothetical protein
MPNYVEKSGFCSYCQQQVLARRKAMSGASHFLHIALSVPNLRSIEWQAGSRLRERGWRARLNGESVSCPESRG